MHDFIVVKNLVAAVILGVVFLCTNGAILTLTNTPVAVHHSNKHLSQGIPKSSGTQKQLFSMYKAANKKEEARISAVKALENPSTDTIEECSLLRFQDSECCDYPGPGCATFQLNTALHDYRDLFLNTSGVTQAAFHHIPTTGNPVKVPPRQIPACYHREVNQLIQEMLHQGIIEESSRPWDGTNCNSKKKVW